MKSLALTTAFLAICSAALAEVPLANVQAPATQSPRAAALKKLDLDGDGFVSREEATQGPGLERRFGRIDGDKDGLLSQEELRMFRERRDTRREDSPRSSDGGRRFAALDADKDGFLTRDEIVGRPEMQKRFPEIDSNNDDRLSREDLRAARGKQ